MPDPKDLAFGGIVGESHAIRQAVDLASKLGESRIQNVLIEGETGTGKELFARGIHYMSEGADQPFAAVNCAAIPPTLLESELFGHERGAFTDARTQKKGLLELAGQGTLLLDEINELPLTLQPKLLRVLEERAVRRLGGVTEIQINCRVVAACNAPLEEAVQRKEFRADLFYRLNVFRVALPPLREREGDIKLLAEHFLREVAGDRFQPPKRLSPKAVEVLRVHAWPGNVRELKNVIHRAVVLSPVEEIHPEHLLIQRRSTGPIPANGGRRGGAEEVGAAGAAGGRPGSGANGRSGTGGGGSGSASSHEDLLLALPRGGATLASIEREAILQTLRLTGGNQSEAARRLGISRPRLARKLDLYRLRKEPELNL